MAVIESIHILQRIRKQYVQAKLWLYAMQTLAGMALGMAILLRWHWEVTALFITAIILVLASVVYFLLRLKSITQTDLKQVANHLNRQYPQLEDSTALLLQEPQNLLQRLQQQKISTRLQDTYAQQQRVFNIRGTASYLTLGLALVTSAGILYLPAAPLKELTNPAKVVVEFPNTPAAVPDTIVKIEQIDISVTPPVYTGKQPYRAQSPNLHIEEGAVVTWRIRTNRPAKQVKLALNEQRPLPFKKEGNNYTLSRSFTASALYTLNLDGQKSAFYTLEIIPDNAPIIQIQKPEQYTEVLFGQPQKVRLQAQLTDDYGIREANMIATVAKGTGEAVKFREEKIKLNLNGNNRSYNVAQILDLQKLGMTYGDELYFYLQAWDNNRGYTRSETYFIQIEDTVLVEADFDMSMGVNPVPEYFRSQRQIIIDTEKLLKDQKSLTQPEFARRANNIGVDQKLLRLRYGKFLGEEFESGIGPGGGIPKDKEGQKEDAHFSGDGHDHEEFADQNSPEALLAPYTHKHDQEGEATIFEPAVKAKLKGALAQMWEAELRLRTHKPKEALPYEYKALRMLKEVQQSQRAYVAKTGFEAPPLKEPELRLSGELNKVTVQSEKTDIAQTKDLPDIRAAMQWLVTYKKTGKYKQADAKILEKAGQEFARIAISRPDLSLHVLQDLRQLIREVKENKSLCGSCLVVVNRTFVELLPTARTSPYSKQNSRSRLGKNYIKRLSENK
jgi:hypothetical protein